VFCFVLFFFLGGGTNSDFFPSRKTMGNYYLFIYGFPIVNFIDFFFFEKNSSNVLYHTIGGKKNLFIS
jgi:hypothetical protein